MPGTNLWIPFQIQLDSTGSGEQEVGAPALGYNWQAFCTLNPAPAGQSQTISVSGQVVASGARQSGPFAAGSGQGVTVTIAGGTASSKVAGVLQGAILPGTAAQAPLPGNGNLFEISGGVIDVSGSDVTIQAGQTGINVSTDAPPVAGPNITIPAGQSSVTDTLHPPANATAIGFAFEPLATYDLQVTVQDALTLVYLENFTFPAAGPGVAGRSFTIPLTPGMTVSGIIVTATAETTLVVNTTVGYSLWYIGTNSIQPVNYPTQPLYVEGAQGSGASIQTVKQAPQHVTPISVQGATSTVITGIAGLAIRLRRLTFQSYNTPSAANYGNWQSTSGVNLWNFNLIQGGQFSHDFEGLALPAGDGLECVQSGGALNLNGVVTWDEY